MIVNDDLNMLPLVGLMPQKQGGQIAAAVLYQPESITNHHTNIPSTIIVENENKK
ncbi:MAG: hypothetical protein HQ525_00285 [Anaerolineae bacterium]|nr:hypothetical protein [Anaerolineae bacterium]